MKKIDEIRKSLLITIILIGLIPFNLTSQNRQKKTSETRPRYEAILELENDEGKEERIKDYFNEKKRILKNYKKQKYKRQSVRGVSKKALEGEDLEMAENMISLLDFINADEESKRKLDSIYSVHPTLKTVVRPTRYLVNVNDKGQLQVRTTLNTKEAKISKASKLWNGSPLGLKLAGSGRNFGIIDGGAVNPNHIEFKERVALIGGLTLDDVNDHATHVAGTVMATGIDPEARGIANLSNAYSTAFTVEGVREMLDKVREGEMPIVNNSWSSSPRPTKEAYYPESFGAYTLESLLLDLVTYDYDYTLLVFAAGNSGEEVNSTIAGSSMHHETLLSPSTAKNVLTVANLEILNSDTEMLGVSDSSSRGPTDDMRIKPDVGSIGTNVYSTFSNNHKPSDTNLYEYKSGTSIASSGVTGIGVLLNEHASNIIGRDLTGPELKGLIIHTAEKISSDLPDGPNVDSGYGLVNAQKAANLITSSKGVRGDDYKIISEELAVGETKTYSVKIHQGGKLTVSLSWYDPSSLNYVSEFPPEDSDINSMTPMIVNDLDIKVIDKDTGVEYFPWRFQKTEATDKFEIKVLNDAPNSRDTYEKIEISGLPSTTRMVDIIVSHKKSNLYDSEWRRNSNNGLYLDLVDKDSQKYSLIISSEGLDSIKDCKEIQSFNPMVDNVENFESSDIKWNPGEESNWEIKSHDTSDSAWGATNYYKGESTTDSENPLYLRSCHRLDLSNVTQTTNNIDATISFRYKSSHNLRLQILDNELGTWIDYAGGKVSFEASSSWKNATSSIIIPHHEDIAIRIVQDKLTFVGKTTFTNFSIDNLMIANNCINGVKDEGEDAIDCGGSFCAPCEVTEAVTHNGSFESDMDGWVGDSVSGVTRSTDYAKDGVYSVKIGDHHRGRTGSITLDSGAINLVDEITFKYNFRLENFTDKNDVRLNYYDGTQWHTLNTITLGQDGVENGQFYERTVVLNADEYRFSTNSQFRIEVGGFYIRSGSLLYIDAVSVAEKTYLDNIVDLCINGIKDGDEDAIDCGGTSCTPCKISPDKQIYKGSFEKGYDEWRRNEARRIVRIKNKKNAKEGQYSLRFVGQRAAPTQAVLNQDLSDETLKEVTFQFSFKPRSLENGDAFVLEYSGSGGKTWETLTTIIKSGSMQNKYDTKSITLDAGAYTFSAISMFRIRLLNFKYKDFIYIDEVKINKKTYLDNDSQSAGVLAASIIDKEFNVFPNPTKGILNINYPSSFVADSEIKIKIYNANGILAFESSEKSGTIDISHLETGVYIIEVSNRYGEDYEERFIKE